MNRERNIDLPVCLLTIAGFEGLSLLNRPFAFGLALVLIVACLAVLWVAGKRSANAVGTEQGGVNPNTPILSEGGKP